MSNVLKKDRNLSSLKVYDNAIKIRTEVIDIAGNEKYVPKRRRLLYGNETVTQAKRVVEYVVKANSIYPSSPEMVFMRKMYQQKAINECAVLIESLRIIVEFMKNVTNRIANLISMIAEEITLLRNWKKSTKLNKNKTKHNAEYGELNEALDNKESTATNSVNSTDFVDTVGKLIMLFEESIIG